ncbi:Ankyrin repeat protein [Pandoravirus kuranda]|uniref:Ankyrin repeat protein n=1 Tax=Pandoravirus kuranda TaxID=3019033 RepID=A0AA95EEV9_9VIRU|nr:Ankyrin repeat protein [Pandoravirus kuranda]
MEARFAGSGATPVADEPSFKKRRLSVAARACVTPSAHQRESPDRHLCVTIPSHVGRLPDEVLAHILAQLPCLVRRRVARVCQRWFAIAKDRAASPRGMCAPATRHENPCASAAAMLHAGCVDHALSIGCPWSGSECESAARHGRADLFARFYDAGCAQAPLWSDMSVEKVAARGGHVGVLRAMAARGITIYWSLVAREAASRGRLECLVYAHAGGHRFESDVCRAAAAGGHLDCLRYLRERGCLWDHTATAAAAAGGHLDCLRYLHEQGCPWDESATDAAVGGADVCDPYARREGHLDCLRYLHEQGCPWDGAVCEVAARRGAVACLTYALDAGCPCDDISATAIVSGSFDTAAVLQAHGYTWTRRVMREAAYLGAWDFVDVLHKYGCPWDKDVCAFAAAAGDIGRIERARACGCPWDADKCAKKAICADRVDVVRWLCEPPNERPLHADSFVLALEHRCSVEMLDLLRRRAPRCSQGEATAVAATWSDCDTLDYLLHQDMIEAAPSIWSSGLQRKAAAGGRLDLMRLLDAEGHRPDSDALVAAISDQRDDCVRWLFDRGCAVRDGALLAAACTGRIDYMRDLRARGCSWSPCAYLNAVTEGHVDCLAYMDADGCPRDSTAMRHAAYTGSVRVMRYLRESGLDWHPNTCTSAIVGRLVFECLAYACENGCPFDMDECMKLAVKSGDARCVHYLNCLKHRRRRQQQQAHCETPL